MSEKTYRIGEAAALLDLKTYVLRFWETEFPQLEPLRTEKGQRLYTEEHVVMLRAIKSLLHDRGMTIDGARRYLAKNGPDFIESHPFLSLRSSASDESSRDSAVLPVWEKSKLVDGAQFATPMRIDSDLDCGDPCDAFRSPGSEIRRKVVAELEAIRSILNAVSKDSRN